MKRFYDFWGLQTNICFITGEKGCGLSLNISTFGQVTTIGSLKMEKRIQLSKKKKQKSHQKTKDIYCFIWIKGLISITLNSKSETRTWELIQYKIKYINQTESRSKNLKTRALQQLVTPAAAAAVFLENVIFTLWEIIKMIFFILQWENCNIGNKHI